MDWNIYCLTWYLLQFVFDVFDIVCRLVYVYPVKTITKCIRQVFGGPENLLDEKHLIECNKEHLDKIPHHLAVILGTEEPDFRILSKIIFWCFSAGIPNISFYDHQGMLNVVNIFNIFNPPPKHILIHFHSVDIP